MNPKFFADRYRRWTLERAIKKAKLAVANAPPEKHGPAGERLAKLVLKRPNLDPIVRQYIEAIVARRHG